MAKVIEKAVGNGFGRVDNAEVSRVSGPGGIDLTPININLQTKVIDSRDNKGIQFYLDPAMLQRLQNAPGFVPVIINIQPMLNLRRFLGIETEENARTIA